MPLHLPSKVRSGARKLKEVAARKPGQATISPTVPSVPASPVPEPSRPPPQTTPSRLVEFETLPLPSLQEKIWSEAYDKLLENEPKVVDAFDKIVSAELRRYKTSADAAELLGNDVISNREARSRQMREYVQDGLERTKREASIKQEVDDVLQAVHAVRGIMDKAVHAAPEAAVVWATVSLGLEVSSFFLAEE